MLAFDTTTYKAAHGYNELIISTYKAAHGHNELIIS